ncbi:MAG TPA: LPS-assembly protein LptD [Deltaproteobacteria bacterium]|nr:LPS-assembly protein LptD [Deltaproteobacteria bacterium]
MISKLKNKLVVTCFAFGMLLFSYMKVSAEEFIEEKKPIEIEADRMDYDYSLDKYHAQGQVIITHSGLVLNADDVELDNKNKIAIARGNVFLKMGEDYLKGDKIVFDIVNKTGVAYKGHAFYARNHFYVRGDKIEKTGEDTYFIEQPRATTCEGESPDWEIAGSEMKVTIDGYGLVKNARFQTKGMPVLYAPFVPFPAKTTRQSGFLMPYISYSRKKDGIDIELPFFWAISPQMDATFFQRYIEKRGYKQGAEFRYYLGEQSFGTFYGDFLEDRKEIIEDYHPPTSRDWEGKHNRWSYYLNHQTNFAPDFYVRTDLRKVSDKWYFKDLPEHNYYQDNFAGDDGDMFQQIPFQGKESMRYLESTARLYKGWSNYNLLGMVSYTDDFATAENSSTFQKYPEIMLTGIRQPFLKTPLYYELTSTYDYFYRGEGQKGHYFDFNPSVSLPMDIAGFARITPQFSFRETLWSRDDEIGFGKKRSGERTIYTASLTANTQLSRIFDANILSWEKIRHEIKPEVGYFYTPDVEQDDITDYILPIDKQNEIAWALTNTLVARVKDKDKDKEGAHYYLEFLRLKIFQTYDINEAKRSLEVEGDKRRPFANMGVELDFRPHKYVFFRARNKYNMYSGWKEESYDLRLTDWRGDMLRVGYRYKTDDIEQVYLNIRAKITSNISATYLLSRDVMNSRTVGSTVGVLYKSQCWSLGVDYSEIDGDSRFIFKFELTGLGTL